MRSSDKALLHAYCIFHRVHHAACLCMAPLTTSTSLLWLATIALVKGLNGTIGDEGRVHCDP